MTWSPTVANFSVCFVAYVTPAAIKPPTTIADPIRVFIHYVFPLIYTATDKGKFYRIKSFRCNMISVVQSH